MQVGSRPRGLGLPALREVRERLGLSQQELATQAGMTRTAVANLERGASRARPSSAHRLAEALHVSVDVLAGQSPIPPSSLSQLPDEQQRIFLVMRVIQQRAPDLWSNLLRAADDQQPSEVEVLALKSAFTTRVAPALSSDTTLEVNMPQGVLSSYLAAAMRHAIFQRAGEQQRVYATIPGISGLWARGQSREEATRDLREALEWWVLTSVFEHRPLPAFGDASLEIEEESTAGSRIVYPAARQEDAAEAGNQGSGTDRALAGS